MTLWLKTIGTSLNPLRDDWSNHAPPLLRYASFAKPPARTSFVPEDEFAYYALRGDISRVVAVGRVEGPIFFDQARIENPGWPWLVPIALEAKKDLISQGFALDLIDVDRPLTRSVTQKSHIRLEPAEFENIKRLFGLA
jgi:hypothetical protein